MFDVAVTINNNNHSKMHSTLALRSICLYLLCATVNNNKYHHILFYLSSNRCARGCGHAHARCTKIIENNILCNTSKAIFTLFHSFYSIKSYKHDTINAYAAVTHHPTTTHYTVQIPYVIM